MYGGEGRASPDLLLIARGHKETLHIHRDTDFASTIWKKPNRHSRG